MKMIWGILIVFLMCGYALAQSDEESLGGIDTPSGLTDLRSSQQRGPFSDFPWDVQSILETHLGALQKLSPAVQNHVFHIAMGWDTAFDVEKQRLIAFLKVVQATSAVDMALAFQDIPEQAYAYEMVMDRLIARHDNSPPALVVIAVTRSGQQRTASVIPKAIYETAVVVDQVAFSENWVQALTARPEKAYPSVWEEIRKQRKLKDPLAVVVVGNAPASAVYKADGCDKKTAPFVISTADLMGSVAVAKGILQDNAGKSEAQLDLLKAKWTPATLKMPKMYRSKDVGNLMLRCLMHPENAFETNDAFKQTLAQQVLWRSQPEALFVEMSDLDEARCQQFVSLLLTSLMHRYRYQDNTLVVIVDEAREQVVFSGYNAGQLSFIQDGLRVEDVPKYIRQVFDAARIHIN